MFELKTLSAVVHKARLVERNKLECRQQSQASRPQYLGKRPAYTSPSTRSYGQSITPKGKKQATGKAFTSFTPSKEGSQGDANEPKVECKVCYGPHDVSVCKWTPGACFS